MNFILLLYWSSDYCSKLSGVWTLFGYVIFMLKIVVPLLLIVMSMIQFTKAIVAGKEKTDSWALIKSKVIAAVIVFLSIQIITTTVNIIADGDTQVGFNYCTKCVFSPFSEGCSLNLGVEQWRTSLNGLEDSVDIVNYLHEFHDGGLSYKKMRDFYTTYIKFKQTADEDGIAVVENSTVEFGGIRAVEEVVYDYHCKLDNNGNYNGNSTDKAYLLYGTWFCVDGDLNYKSNLGESMIQDNVANSYFSYVLSKYSVTKDDQWFNYTSTLLESPDAMFRFQEYSSFVGDFVSAGDLEFRYYISKCAYQGDDYAGRVKEVTLDNGDTAYDFSCAKGSGRNAEILYTVRMDYYGQSF